MLLCPWDKLPGPDGRFTGLRRRSQKAMPGLLYSSLCVSPSTTYTLVQT